MTRTTAVVLAAGLSRRMGEQNKLLLPIAGQPMIVHTLRAYQEACDDVLVVTGFDADNITAALRPLNLRLVHNVEFAKGQATSVATGLRTALGADQIIVGLGDQPSLRGPHLHTLIRRHETTGGRKITVPTNGTARGNPIVIPGGLVDQMLEDRQNPGCGKFTRQRPDLVDLIPLTDPAYYRDVDTPEDYAAVFHHMPTTEYVQ
ncbi:MAG: nucleotidyltransferase family protein [Pseudomonadota bacterium]